jgi:aconitate hydratase
MLPFIAEKETFDSLELGDKIIVHGIVSSLESMDENLEATVVKKNGNVEKITLSLPALAEGERDIILRGCLINYYASEK